VSEELRHANERFTGTIEELAARYVQVSEAVFGVTIKALNVDSGEELDRSFLSRMFVEFLDLAKKYEADHVRKES